MNNLLKRNAEGILYKLLYMAGLRISLATLQAEIKLHPHHSSLLGISDILDNYNIENSAYEVPFEDLTLVPLPFLTYTKSKGRDFLLIEQFKENHIIAFNGIKTETLQFDEFKKIYNGVILSADLTKNRSHFTSNLTFKIKKHLTPTLPVSIILLISCFWFVFAIWHSVSRNILFNGAIGALVICKLAGMLVTAILLTYTFQANNLVNKICKRGKVINCNTILSSDAAKLFSWLSWSEIGFCYFAGTLLMMAFEGLSNTMNLINIINLCSLPYTLYSIYHQAIVEKKWCLLCVTVQVILWFERIALFFSSVKYRLYPGDILELRYLLFVFAGWFMIKPIIEKVFQNDELQDELKKFKFNTAVFNRLLSANPRFPNPESEWSINLGNPDAEKIITVFSNPYCEPCSKAHMEIADWIDNRKDVRFRIVFAIHVGGDKNNSHIISHLMRLNELEDKTTIKIALHDWYAQKVKVYAQWAKKYPVPDFEVYTKLVKQNQWSIAAGVTHTPQIFVNGFVVPPEYNLRDLKYLVLQDTL